MQEEGMEGMDGMDGDMYGMEDDMEG